MSCTCVEMWHLHLRPERPHSYRDLTRGPTTCKKRIPRGSAMGSARRRRPMEGRSVACRVLPAGARGGRGRCTLHTGRSRVRLRGTRDSNSASNLGSYLALKTKPGSHMGPHDPLDSVLRLAFTSEPRGRLAGSQGKAARTRCASIIVRKLALLPRMRKLALVAVWTPAQSGDLVAHGRFV